MYESNRDDIDLIDYGDTDWTEKTGEGKEVLSSESIEKVPHEFSERIQSLLECKEILQENLVFLGDNGAQIFLNSEKYKLGPKIGELEIISISPLHDVVETFKVTCRYTQEPDFVFEEFKILQKRNGKKRAQQKKGLSKFEAFLLEKLSEYIASKKSVS